MQYLIAVILICVGFSLSEVYGNPVKGSHIRANVPDAEKLHSVIRMGLLEYFRKRYGATEISYELLADRPTQTGVAFPKFYAWIKLRGVNSKFESGAVRMSLRDRKYCVVTHYLTLQAIRDDPKSAFFVFPKALLPKVFKKSGIKVDLDKNTPTEKEWTEYLNKSGRSRIINSPEF